jgi:two-component system response regulator DesR
MMAACHDRATIRLIVVDDHACLREAIAEVLDATPGLEVVGVTGDGAAVVRLVEEQRPDLVLLDVRLGLVSGVDVAQHLRHDFPHVAVLVLTGHDDVGVAQALLQIGVRGFLPKTASIPELVGAIRTVAGGRAVLAWEAVQQVLGSGMTPLTRLEQQMLDLLAAGYADGDIATVLGLSIRAVELHGRHLLGKLHARDRAEAVSKAQRFGLVLSG